MWTENQIQRELFLVISEVESLQRQAIQLKYKLEDALAKKAKLEAMLTEARGGYDSSALLAQKMTLDLLQSEVGDL